MRGVMKLDIKRITVGSVLTILSISLLSMAFFWFFTEGGDLTLFFANAAGVASSIVALAFVLFWGLPIHLVLAKYQKTAFWWYTIAGFLPGPLFIFALKPFGSDAPKNLIIQSSYCGVVGAIGAVLFWFYVVKRAS